VADDGVAKVLSAGILMNERTNGVAHVALIDGGTLETKILHRATVRGAKNGTGSPELSMPFPELCDGGRAFPSFVHFNGGVLRARAAGNLLGARTETADTRPTDVLVYGKGAILDSSNYTVTVNAPLKAPTGSGVASIDLPTGKVRTGYLGAPVVSIYGDGEGATAVAIFDKDTGPISGFRITSPGRNYTTATARLAGGGKSSITNILACTVAENTSGGLTKRGTGLLALNAANTYGGRTVLEGGVLRLDADGALPSGSAVELAGGALDANGHAAPTDWRLDFSRVAAAGAPIICPGSLDFPAGSTLTIENVDDEFLAAQEGGFPLLSVTGLVTGTPALAGFDNPLWRLVWRGGSLYVSSTRGTTVILR
jgi:autotransporter-associated beta strand protein